MSTENFRGDGAGVFDGGRYRVLFPDDDQSWFVGRVVGNHFHVEDEVYNGISNRKLLGQAPDLRPMAIRRLVELGARFEPITGG